jgi:hypothetical protein
MCGLQEVRHAGSGSHTFDNGYHFIWSGKPPDKERPHEHGVGVLLSPDTAKLLRASTAGSAALDDRTLVLRFHPNGTVPITAIVAYAPTDASTDTTAKDAFYDQLHGILADIPPHHFLLVMGDFNATTTAATPITHPSVGQHACPTPHSPRCPFPPNPLHPRLALYNHNPSINGNGQRLLDLCAAHDLSITHSFFPTPSARAYTWYSNDGRTCSILDYILVRRSHLSSVQSVRAQCPITRPIPSLTKADHSLVTARIQFHFSKTWTNAHFKHTRPQPPARYFTDLLHSPVTAQRYAEALEAALAPPLPPLPALAPPLYSPSSSPLSPTPPSSRLDQLMNRFVTAVHAVAKKIIGPRPREIPISFNLSEASLKHAQKLQAARARNAPQTEVKTCEAELRTSLRGDTDAHWKASAALAQTALNANKPHTAYQILKKLVGDRPLASAPALRTEGGLRFGAQPVADAFGKHFKQLHTLPSTVDEATLNTHLAHTPTAPPFPAPTPAAAAPLTTPAPTPTAATQYPPKPKPKKGCSLWDTGLWGTGLWSTAHTPTSPPTHAPAPAPAAPQTSPPPPPPPHPKTHLPSPRPHGERWRMRSKPSETPPPDPTRSPPP